MEKLKSEYKADNGRNFVLVRIPDRETNATLSTYKVGHVFGSYVAHQYVESGCVEEIPIPGWTKLKGYEVVYYNDGYRLYAGNPQVFPNMEMAEKFKQHYEAYSWFQQKLLIEEVEYEGVPLKEAAVFEGKPVVDQTHYFGLHCYAAGDYFDKELVDELINSLPPACMKTDCMQMGEAISERLDERTGRHRPTYATFKRITADIYEYCGDCFCGENKRHGKEPALC